MESTKDLADVSWAFPGIYHYLNNNTSSQNLSFGTNATGIIDIPEKEAFTIRHETLEKVKIPSETNMLDTMQVEKTPLILNLVFGKEVENLIMRELTFRKFIIEIERSLNEFIKRENVRLENKIFFEEDWEIPDYTKLVLSLNFKGIPFKQKMSLWKMINTITYGRIKSMISNSSEDHINRFLELRKFFFIKLEM